jgi:hypothetical protein
MKYKAIGLTIFLLWSNIFQTTHGMTIPLSRLNEKRAKLMRDKTRTRREGYRQGYQQSCLTSISNAIKNGNFAAAFVAINQYINYPNLSADNITIFFNLAIQEAKSSDYPLKPTSSKAQIEQTANFKYIALAGAIGFIGGWFARSQWVYNLRF